MLNLFTIKDEIVVIDAINNTEARRIMEQHLKDVCREGEKFYETIFDGSKPKPIVYTNLTHGSLLCQN